MHVADGDCAAAVSVLRDVQHLSARNNLFALERYLRWRCWVEGMGDCAVFASTLVDSAPQRAEDANARIAALRFLGELRAARDAWQDVQGQDYWGGASPEEEALYASLGPPDEPVPPETPLWFPQPFVQCLRRLAQASTGSSPDTLEPQFDAQLDSCDAHADYLQRACVLAETPMRFLALSVLKRRAKSADAPACAALQALLLSLGGPDDERMKLLRWLQEHGLRDAAQPVKILLAGSVREIRSVSMNIHGEPRPSPFLAASQPLANRMFKALQNDALEEAEHPARPGRRRRRIDAAVRTGAGPAAELCRAGGSDGCWMNPCAISSAALAVEQPQAA